MLTFNTEYWQTLAKEQALIKMKKCSLEKSNEHMFNTQEQLLFSCVLTLGKEHPTAPSQTTLYTIE